MPSVQRLAMWLKPTRALACLPLCGLMVLVWELNVWTHVPAEHSEYVSIESAGPERISPTRPIQVPPGAASKY